MFKTEPQFSERAITKKGMLIEANEKNNVNEYSRVYENSPTFSFANAELIASAEEIFDFFQDKPEMQKYGAMNTLTIANSSGTALKIYPNQDRTRYFIIPAGTIRIFDKDDLNAGLNSIIIYNSGIVTATAGEITIETYKKGVTQEKLIQSIHKKIFSFGKGSIN